MATKKFSVLTIIRKQLRLMIDHGKWIFLLLFLVHFFTGGLLPFISIYIPRVIVDFLMSATDETLLVQQIIGLTSILLVLGSIDAFISAVAETSMIRFRVEEFHLMNKKYQEIDYAHLENPKFRDRAGVAIHALDGNGMGFEGVYHNLYSLLPLLASILAFSVLIGLFQPLILITSLFGSVVIFYVNKGITRYVDFRKKDRERTHRQRDYFYQTCYDFTYGKDIRVYQLQEKINQDYKQKSYSFLKVLIDIANRRFLLGLFEILMLLLQDGVSYFFIIISYMNGYMTLGEVSLYVGAIIALSTALRNFTTTLTDLAVNAKYSQDYFEFRDDHSLVSLQGTHQRFASNESLKIEFKDVSFRYPGTEAWVLQHFNLTIQKGEKLAIVGVNGAGKSTLVKLITGLFSIDEGQILVNDVDIQSFDQKSYQSMFSVVFQDFKIYAGTVLENIIGTDTSEEAREKGKQCLARVGLTTKIESLPKQYDHPLLKVIEADGVELSGGENQKMAIARALYKDGNMVILDEPTSALDALAEATIYQSFNDLVAHKTAIYVSHRLASTKFCDHILLLDRQGIKEYGTHDELMALQGEYYHMFTTQGKYYVEGSESHD